jgi:hypothetical protein
MGLLSILPFTSAIETPPKHGSLSQARECNSYAKYLETGFECKIGNFGGKDQIKEAKGGQSPMKKGGNFKIRICQVSKDLTCLTNS